MSKKLIIHDLSESLWQSIVGSKLENEHIFAAAPTVKPCLGCFGCWLKTPGACIIKDRCQILPEMIASCDEVIILSRCRYGGFSPDVKAVLDRSIGYMLPFFRMHHGEMHHVQRYKESFIFRVFMYGDISEKEQFLARELVQANALNFGVDDTQINFYPSVESLKGVFA